MTILISAFAIELDLKFIRLFGSKCLICLGTKSKTHEVVWREGTAQQSTTDAPEHAYVWVLLDIFSFIELLETI